MPVIGNLQGSMCAENCQNRTRFDARKQNGAVLLTDMTVLRAIIIRFV